MSTSTFKGARYITAFANPIQWNSQRAYEAITAVQHNGFTYISKQPVPIGVQITNDDFWLLWADPNAQMEQLRQIVEEYADNVSELSGVVGDLTTELGEEINSRINEDTNLRNFINSINQTEVYFFGDSWGFSTPLCTQIANKLHLNAHNYHVQGAGFIAKGSDNKNFLEKLQSLNLSSSDVQNVKYVFICGLTNDMGLSSVPTQSELTTAVHNYAEALKAIFTKSQIIFTPNYRQPNYGALNANLMRLYYSACDQWLLEQLPCNQDSITWLQNLGWWNADRIHLNNTGYYKLAGNIIASISAQPRFMYPMELTYLAANNFNNVKTVCSFTNNIGYINSIFSTSRNDSMALGLADIQYISQNSLIAPIIDVYAPFFDTQDRNIPKGTVCLGSNGRIAIYPNVNLNPQHNYTFNLCWCTTNYLMG